MPDPDRYEDLPCPICNTVVDPLRGELFIEALRQISPVGKMLVHQMTRIHVRCLRSPTANALLRS